MPNPAAVAATLRGASGPVHRYMLVLATKVQTRARELVGVKTGNLKSTIVKRVTPGHGGLVVLVGSSLPYARFHHDGTKPHVIRPRNPDGVLAFEVGGETRFARFVNHPGTRPNPFLTKAAHQVIGQTR